MASWKRPVSDQTWEESPRKLLKYDEDDLYTTNHKNFSLACKQVSFQKYLDYRSRFLLVYLPKCVNGECNHQFQTKDIIISNYIVEAFKIEMRNKQWDEALETCHMCITKQQSLTCDVLKDLVEIMLNAHEDTSKFTVKNIVANCQLVLSRNFSTHPPCRNRRIREIYSKFLTSPIVFNNPFTTGPLYKLNNGIVNYCMTRLEMELRADSKDDPLLNTDENIPIDKKDSLEGMHWKTTNLQIFDALNRQDRMDRLFSVLETVIELLQFDLAICLSWRKSFNNNTQRIRKLIDDVLWPNGTYKPHISSNCKQIIRLFMQIIHLEYPTRIVRIFTMWLNTVIQALYFCETYSDASYPTTSSFCREFAKEFVLAIEEIPLDSRIRIFERIEPTFMRDRIGLEYLNRKFKCHESNVILLLTNIITDSRYFSDTELQITLPKKIFLAPEKTEDKISYLLSDYLSITEVEHYRKMEPQMQRNPKQAIMPVDLNHVMKVFYITMKAFLDTYDLYSLFQRWNDLNEQKNENLEKCNNYYVTEVFVQNYKDIIENLHCFAKIYNNLKKQGKLLAVYNIFEEFNILR